MGTTRNGIAQILDSHHPEVEGRGVLFVGGSRVANNIKLVC